MILNDKIATQIGDTIVLQSVPMLNLTQLDTFTDVIIGTTVDRYFEKEFRYSLDGGVTFSDWFILSDVNLQLINVKLTTNWHELVFVLKYKRAGIDNTGQLELVSITINGQYVERALGFTISNRSIYKDLIYDNIDVLNLMINLAQKMYSQGIVPLYMTRAEESDSILGDEDYVDFWQVISKFFSILFVDAIKFENIYWRRNLLCEYLKQRNIFFCNCDDIIELQLIAQNYFDEIRQRGTEEVFHPKNYEYATGYRTSYQMPVDYEIRPAYPVMIDGIAYAEINTLPFGWTVDSQQLISPEKNYHKVLFYNDITLAFDILPVLKFTMLPTLNSGILKRYNGEYLRLICFNEKCDEYIYNNVPKRYIGWCLGSSSPMYRGLRPQRNKSLLKAYEKQADVLDLEKYPLINQANVYIGVSSTPVSLSGTIMYISASGSPCFTDILPKLKNASTHLTLKLRYKAVNNVVGLINVTNIVTLDTFQIPLFLTGDGNEIAVNTDLIPGNYNVEFDLTFNDSVGGVLFAGSLEYPISSTNSAYNQIFSLDQVDDPNINIELNFSKTGTTPPVAVIVNQIGGFPSDGNPNSMLQINNLTPITNCVSPAPGIDFHDIDPLDVNADCFYSFRLPVNQANFSSDYTIHSINCIAVLVTAVLDGGDWLVTVKVGSFTAITCFVCVEVTGSYFTYEFTGGGHVDDLFEIYKDGVPIVSSSIDASGFLAFNVGATVKAKVSRSAGDCQLSIRNKVDFNDLFNDTQPITVEYIFVPGTNVAFDVVENIL